MIDLAELIADREEFKAWLTVHPDGAIVGRSGQDWDCPISNWLTMATRGERVYVGSVVVVYEDDKKIGTPRWASLFIDEIDTRWGREITREQALTVLEALP